MHPGIKLNPSLMKRQGVIEKVTEHSAWCHPIVLVEKKNEKEKRLSRFHAFELSSSKVEPSKRQPKGGDDWHFRE